MHQMQKVNSGTSPNLTVLDDKIKVQDPKKMVINELPIDKSIHEW